MSTEFFYRLLILSSLIVFKSDTNYKSYLDKINPTQTRECEPGDCPPSEDDTVIIIAGS